MKNEIIKRSLEYWGLTKEDVEKRLAHCISCQVEIYVQDEVHQLRKEFENEMLETARNYAFELWLKTEEDWRETIEEALEEIKRKGEL